jgi:hypothetical protein
MDERKSELREPAASSLRAAMRRARLENAEQSQAVSELREAEIARLELLLEAIRPVLDQAPEGVELFDAGIERGGRPRLFLDMIGFVELGHDRRTYRFFQDTRHGRVVIAESPQIDRIVAAVTNYVARRLIERERALAADWRSGEAPAAAPAPKPANGAKPLGFAAARPPAARRGWRAGVADFFGLLLQTFGAIALMALIGFAAYKAWTLWGRALWTARFGPPPI